MTNDDSQTFQEWIVDSLPETNQTVYIYIYIYTQARISIHSQTMSNKRTKAQLTKDTFIAYGDHGDSSDGESGMDTPQMASEAVMKTRKIAGLGRKFGAKRSNQTTSTTNSLNTFSTDPIQLSQMKSLNANFLKSINDGITKNPVANFSEICNKYMDYISKIENKKIQVKSMEVPKVEVKPESIKSDDSKPNPFSAFSSFGSNTSSNSNTNTTTPKTNDTTTFKPVANVPLTPAVPKKADNAEKVASASEDEDNSEDEKKPTEIKGPTFKIAEIPKSKSYGFQFGKAPEKDPEDSSDDEIEIKGPVFQTNAKVDAGPFKLPKTTEAKTKEETTKSEEKPKFSFNPPTPTSNTSTEKSSTLLPKPSFNFGAPSQSTEKKIEPVKSAFNFGTPATTPFTFGNNKEQPQQDEKKIEPANSAFNMGSSIFDTNKDVSKPKFNFGANSTTSDLKPSTGISDMKSTPSNSTGAASETTTDKTTTEEPSKPALKFNFGASANTTSNTNTGSVFSFGKTTSSTSSNPFSIGGTTTSAFGNNASNVFNFSVSAPKPANTTKTITSAENTSTTEGDEESKDAENDTVKGNFAVIQLTEKVDVKTGEEDEETLYSKRSKLTKYNSESKAYDSVGLGELKILKNKNTGKSRILVRADVSSNVILNVLILKDLDYDIIGDKKVMVRIPCFNAGGQIETYLARVKTADDAQELLANIKKCQ